MQPQVEFTQCALKSPARCPEQHRVMRFPVRICDANANTLEYKQCPYKIKRVIREADDI